MKFNFKGIVHSIDYFNFTPILVLIWGIISVLFLPILPVASGYGWDGIFYGQVALDFSNMIGNNISSYHANRIFPGVLIHYVYLLLKIPLNVQSALLGFQIYHIIILTSSSILWVLISKHLSLKLISKWIGFIALFCNFPMMKLIFYYPVLTDGTAFFLGLLMLYAYLKHNNIFLIFGTIIAFFCWPAGVVTGIILFVFKNSGYVKEFLKEKNTNILFFAILLSPFLILIGTTFAGQLRHWIAMTGLAEKYFGKYRAKESFTPINPAYLINATIQGVYLVFMFWYLLKNFDIIKFIKNCLNKNLILNIVIIGSILIILMIIKRLIYSPEIPSLNAYSYFASIYFYGPNVRFPLQFIIYQVCYWGPIMILLIIFFKDIITKLKNSEIPFLLIFLIAIIFSINSEARPLNNFYPFLVVLILKSIDIDKFKNKKAFVNLFIIVSLILSKVWIFGKLPSSVYPETIYEDIDKFPMQWYFMSFGYFANTQMFFAHASFALLILVLFYFVIKKSKYSN